MPLDDADKFITAGTEAFALLSKAVADDPCRIGDMLVALLMTVYVIDGLEEIFAGLRERHVDDSVCGLCEYDGAYLGQSGDWCNECPGFEKDDCFKLSGKIRKEWTDEIIKALPSAQPEQR